MARNKPKPQLRSAALRGEKTLNLEEYNKIVRKAEILSVRLLSSEFNVDPELYSKDDPSKKREFIYDHDQNKITFDAEKGMAVGVFEWCIDVPRGADSLLHLKSSWLVAYDNLKGCNENEVHIFVRRVGQFAAYPYWRTFVSQMSWMSGARLPILPVLREPQSADKSTTELLEDRRQSARR